MGDRYVSFLKEHHAPYGLMNGYGMTEMAGPVCTSNHKFPVMLPFFCNNIKILDIDTGEELDMIRKVKSVSAVRV